MAIRITHIDGPLAGKVQEFANDKGRILIGRVTAEADVRYPDDFTAVSREHVVLVEGPGIYRLDLSTAKPVFVNGEPALQDQELRGTMELQLGGRDGPRLRVEINPGLAGAQTVARTQMADLGTKVKGTRRLATWIAAAVVLLAVVVGGLTYYFREEAVNLKQFVESLPPPGGGAEITPAMLQQARDSVYLVLVKDAGGEAGQGTSWVAGDGIMATNSHVAEIFFELEPGQELMVRSPVEPYVTHKVLRVELHPGYLAFSQRMAEFGPVVKALGQQVLDAGLIGAYDVALMYVDQPEKLGKPMKIASEDDLKKLDAGSPVAYMGYPMENMALTALVVAPTPQSKIGNITTVTDYFNIHRKDGDNHLIQHDVGATGGASGSPMINEKGEVVAVLSAVNFIFLSSGEARIPSGASINFGQRADLVQELLDGKAQEATVAYAATWEEALKLFTDFRSVLPTLILSDLKSWLGTETNPIMLKEEKGTIGPLNEEWGYNVTRYGIELPEPGAYAFEAIGNGTQNIDIYLVQNGEVVNYDNNPDYFAYVINDFAEKGSVQIVVVGETEGQPYTFRAYYWNYQMVPPPQ
jgi:hypothetical protein